MSRTASRRVAQAAVIPSLVALVVTIVTASPAGAHTIEGGSLPAPPWLLAYAGSFVVVITAAVLRTSWPEPRAVGATEAAATPPSPATGRPTPGPLALAGHAIGTLLLALVFVAATVGPDSYAANVAPVAVLVVWWVGLPIACLLTGDVMARVNPFQLPVSLLERLRPRSAEPTTHPPDWTGAVFLAAFTWFLLAYHRPGSPRALAVFLAVYSLAAIGGGRRWGRGWLSRGEGFGALSGAVALVSWRGSDRRAVPGLAALMLVWIGGTAFDAFTSTPFWADILGTARGWSRTLLSTVGLLWITAIVAGAYLIAVRMVEQRTPSPAAEPSHDDGDRDRDDRGSLASLLGVALVPVGLGWFLAHDITLLLLEGQSFIVLVSDPLGRGWDLFGTIESWSADYSVVRDRWVRWVQLALLLVGHVVAVVLAHDVAIRRIGRRAGVQVTWAMAVVAAASIVAATLLVLG